MNKIEILSVEILEQQRALIYELRALAAMLGQEFGWHYLLDLAWIISQLGEVHGKIIMDAGAGVGVMQWYLAEHGATVLSVDRGSRASLPLKFRARYRVSGLRAQDLQPAFKVAWHNLSRLQVGVLARSAQLALRGKAPGAVTLYHQDLRTLSDVASDSLDAVVAVSALEHNTPENLKIVSAELTRVLKPGGKLLATLGAARDSDWFHKPSQGWCYTAASLRAAFGLPADTPDNYARHDELLAALRTCAELRDNLAGFYSKSGENGMPWGRWDPQYQPVGVLKTK